MNKLGLILKHTGTGTPQKRPPSFKYVTWRQSSWGWVCTWPTVLKMPLQQSARPNTQDASSQSAWLRYEQDCQPPTEECPEAAARTSELNRASSLSCVRDQGHRQGSMALSYIITSTTIRIMKFILWIANVMSWWSFRRWVSVHVIVNLILEIVQCSLPELI